MQILITGAKDGLMWYADKIGERVELLGEEPDFYWSREPAGYRNIVYKEDAELIYDT